MTIRPCPPRPRPLLTLSDSVEKEVARRFEEISTQQRASVQAAPVSSTLEFPLTTVSSDGTYKAYLRVGFSGSDKQEYMHVDSGNTFLIVPHGELLNQPDYEILGEGTEPWGCPVKVLQGPVHLYTVDEETYTIERCIFCACTGPNRDNERTSNFGIGYVEPWPMSVGGNQMRSPLFYSQYSFAEIAFAPAKSVFSDGPALTINDESRLTLSQKEPTGYTILPTIRDTQWMSVVPQSLAIGDTFTQWPGSVNEPMAFVDTGGGPVLLSDPNGYIYKCKWPPSVECPKWSSGSDSCTCTRSNVTIALVGSSDSTGYAYTIDTTNMPTSVQKLTLVACKKNKYMWDMQGMNIGGISLLFNQLLIDYSKPRIGLKPQPKVPGYYSVDVRLVGDNDSGADTIEVIFDVKVFNR